MFAAVGGADAIKRVGTRGLALAGGAEAVGKFLTIISEDLGDRERGLVDQAREETPPAEAADLSWRRST